MNPDRTNLNLPDGLSISRLSESYDYSRRMLEPFRQHRITAIRQFVGKHYGDQGAPAKNVLNLMDLAIQIYLRILSTRQAQVMVSGKRQEFAADAYAQQMGMNHLLKKIDYDALDRAWTMESLFGLGVMKVGMNVGQEIEVDGESFVTGQPYAKVVDFDDYTIDMASRDRREILFEAHRYTLPAHIVENSPVFDKNAVKELTTSRRLEYIDSGGHASSLTAGGGGEDADPIDFYTLIDIYLPMHGWFITVGSNEVRGFSENHVLVSQPWEGAPGGPFVRLSYTDVPGNVPPVPMTANILDAHLDVNLLHRKLQRQAERNKTTYPIPGGMEDDAQKFTEARDGAAFPVKNNFADRIKPLIMPGPNPQNFAFMLQVLNLAKRMNGNLEAVGGLSPQSETLGQDQLLFQQASQRLEDMADIKMAATQKVIEKLAWYVWHDPFIEIPLTKRSAGLDIPFVFRPSSLRGNLFDYQFELHPFSMVRQTPDTKLNRLLFVLGNFIAPMAPFMQQQGMTINMDALMTKVAEYSGLDEIRHILDLSDLPPMPGDETGQKPQHTRREYVRRNVSSGGRDGGDTALINRMMGLGGSAGGQEAQTNQMFGNGGA